MKEETYTCECGKSFNKLRGMTGHQANCKIHQKLLHDQREARRLPNGMFKCENPDCGKEHDGSYGSGRFCSVKCRRHYTAIVGNQTAINNGNKKCNFNVPGAKHHKANYGTWKCRICNLIFDTRCQRNKHNQQYHYTGKPGNKPGYAWNHGLTRTTPSVCKRTEPYTRKDGTIVNLDSSYERTIAKILDEHDIDWIRPKPLDWYSKDGVKHHYFPDFYLTKYDIYLDPKNDYCFKVQAEKISYVKEHYANCIFMTKDQLTWEYLEKILESQSSPVTTPHC